MARRLFNFSAKGIFIIVQKKGSDPFVDMEEDLDYEIF